MTAQSIQKQVDDIKKVTAELVKSKEGARKFLHDYGIIRPESLKEIKKNK